jgi:hypothetical protein
VTAKGIVTSRELVSQRGERASMVKASEYGGDGTRLQLASPAANNRTKNLVIGKLSNRVIDYQITRLSDSPIVVVSRS